jgi:putative sigma-54 modulation protein
MKTINIQSLHFKASEKLESFINEKVSKVFDLEESILKADVTLFEGAAGNPQNQYCEIHLSVRGEDIFVKKNAENYEKATVLAVDALKTIIQKSHKVSISKRKTVNE